MDRIIERAFRQVVRARNPKTMREYFVHREKEGAVLIPVTGDFKLCRVTAKELFESYQVLREQNVTWDDPRYDWEKDFRGSSWSYNVAPEVLSRARTPARARWKKDLGSAPGDRFGGDKRGIATTTYQLVLGNKVDGEFNPNTDGPDFKVSGKVDASTILDAMRSQINLVEILDSDKIKLKSAEDGFGGFYVYDAAIPSEVTDENIIGMVEYIDTEQYDPPMKYAPVGYYEENKGKKRKWEDVKPKK